MQPWLDQVKRELENTVFSPPDWAVDRLKHNLAEAIAKAIPKCFTESLHEVIAKSVEKALADVVSRGVAEGVEKGIRPLVEEIALLRQALETNLDDDWWKDGKDDDPDNGPEDEGVF
jgi:hypothetical protein